jgi:cation transport regulator ChaB
MKNIPNAGAGSGSRADIAESENLALQKQIEKELGATFDEIGEVINSAVQDYDYSKDDKNARRRQKRREEAAAKVAEQQKEKR